jgi:hypothetical protein
VDSLHRGGLKGSHRHEEFSRPLFRCRTRLSAWLREDSLNDGSKRGSATGLSSFLKDGRSSTSLGDAPFGDWRCWTKAIDHAVREAAIEVVQFSLNEAAYLGRVTHCAEIQQ